MTGLITKRWRLLAAPAAAAMLNCTAISISVAETPIEGLRELVLSFGAASAVEGIHLRWKQPVTVRFEHTPRAAKLIVARAPQGGRGERPSNLQLGGVTATTAATARGFEIALTFKQPMISHLARSGDTAELRFEPAVAAADQPSAPVVRLEATPAGPRLVIVTRKPRPAAVFQYGGHYWIIVATPHAVRVSGTTPGLVARFGAVELTQFKDAAAIRIGGIQDHLATVEQDGAVWRVAFHKLNRIAPKSMPQPASPGKPEPAIPQPGATAPGKPASAPPGPSVRAVTPRLVRNDVGAVTVEIPNSPGAAPVRIVDPVVGATLYVVPVTSSGIVVPQGYRYMPFRILPTLVGLAVEPIADGVSVRRRDADVIVRYLRRATARRDRKPAHQDAQK